MFEQDNALNEVFVQATAKTYRKGQAFPHTTGMVFRILEGKIKATKDPRRDGMATERIITATDPDGCSIFVTNPSSDYIALEDTRVFAFPREQALEIFNNLLDRDYCIHVKKGHITLPPPKPDTVPPPAAKTEAPKELPRKAPPTMPEPAVTMPAIPAAKLRMSTPPQSFAPTDSIKPIPSQKPTMAFPFVVACENGRNELPPIEKTDPASIGRSMPRHRTRIGLPFPSTYVSGEVKDIVPVTLRATEVRR